MDRDGISAEEAEIQIAEARDLLTEMLENGEDTDEFLMDHFGVEDDYLFDLI